MLVREPAQILSGIIIWIVPSKVDEVLQPASFVGHFIMALNNRLVVSRSN